MICHGLSARATHPDEVSVERERVSWRGNGHLATNQQQRAKPTIPPPQTMPFTSHGPNFLSPCSEICASEASQHLTWIAVGAWSCNGEMNCCFICLKQVSTSTNTEGSNHLIGIGGASSLAWATEQRDIGHCFSHRYFSYSSLYVTQHPHRSIQIWVCPRADWIPDNSRLHVPLPFLYCSSSPTLISSVSAPTIYLSLSSFLPLSQTTKWSPSAGNKAHYLPPTDRRYFCI